MSLLGRTQEFLNSRRDESTFNPPGPAPTSPSPYSGVPPATSDSLAEILKRQTVVARSPLRVAIQPVGDSRSLTSAPDSIPPYPDLRPFLSDDELRQFEATNVDLDRLGLTVGTLAHELAPEAIFTMLGTWSALRDVVGHALKPRPDGVVSFQGADPGDLMDVPPAAVPLTLLTKAWLAFLVAARSRAPGFDIAERQLPVKRLDFAALDEGPVPAVVEAIKAARGRTTRAKEAKFAGPAELVALKNELGAERKLREAAEARAREAQRVMDEHALRLREMTRLYESTESMKLVHATVQDFNMFPVQLADAMRRLHEKQAELSALEARFGHLDGNHQSSAAELLRLQTAYDAEVNAHRICKSRLLDAELLYENLQLVSGASVKDNVANLDLIKKKVIEAEELRKQLASLEEERAAMITNRAEMAEKITQLTNENAVFVRENGILKTEVMVNARKLKEREIELGEATGSLTALSSIVGELKSGNSSVLRAFQNKLDRAERKNSALTEKIEWLTKAVKTFKAEKVDRMAPALLLLRRTLLDQVEQIRTAFTKEVIQVYQDAAGMMEAQQAKYDELQRTHVEFITFHNETVADYTTRISALDAEISDYQNQVAENLAEIQALTAALAQAEREREGQRARAAEAEAALAQAQTELAAANKEIAILQKAAAELRILREEFAALQVERDHLARELQISNLKVETITARAAAFEEKNRQLQLQVDTLQGVIVQREAAIQALEVKVTSLQDYADDVMKEVANEKKKADDAVTEVRRLSLELEKKLNSPDTALALRFKDLVNKSLKIRTLDIPFSRPMTRTKFAHKGADEDGGGGGERPNALSGTWKDLAQEKLLSFFDAFDPLVAEVDERGLYRLQLPPQTGNWTISARGLLIIRNMDRDFPGIIIPPMPGGLRDAQPQVSFARDTERPRLPTDLPVHAYQSMHREPTGMGPWIDRHMNRRRSLHLSTIQPNELVEQPSEADEYDAARGVLPSEASLAALMKPAMGYRTGSRPRKLSVALAGDHDIAFGRRRSTSEVPYGYGTPDLEQPSIFGVAALPRVQRVHVGVTAPASEFKQMDGWRSSAAAFLGARDVSIHVARTPSVSPERMPLRLPEIGRTSVGGLGGTGAQRAVRAAPQSARARIMSSEHAPGAARNQVWRPPPPPPPSLDANAEATSIGAWSAGPSQATLDEGPGPFDAEGDDRRRFVVGFASGTSHPDPESGEPEDDGYTYGARGLGGGRKSVLGLGLGATAFVKVGLDDDLMMDSVKIPLKERSESVTRQRQRDYSPPKPKPPPKDSGSVYRSAELGGGWL